jgi:hypothetical protein
VRRIAIWVLALSLLIGGCNGGRPHPPTTSDSIGPTPSAPGPGPVKQTIARADAEALVSAYLQDRVEGRQSAAVQRLVPAARGEEQAAEPPWSQFALVQSTEVDEGWLIQTREYRSAATEGRSLVVTDFYLVVREGDQLAIDRPARRWQGAKAAPYRRAAVEAHPDPKQPEKRLLVTKDGQTVLAQLEPPLPKTFRPYGAPADALFGVGDSGWGTLALSPMADRIAFVTRGTHPFLGIVNGDNQVQGLDLWFEGGAGELAWSHDSHYLAATNMSPRGIFVLYLWDLRKGAPVQVKGLPDGRDVSRLQWQGGTLHLRSGAERWMVNPVTGEAKPVPSGG